MRAASSRRWRSAAGRWRPSSSATRAGSRATRQSLVAMLRSSHFIRSSGSSERVETYHDRIREVLAAQIAPDAVRRIHGRMVQALVERRSDDCEALFEHYRGAGDHENASIQAGLAAAKAGAALAFDRAAFFYRQALALSAGIACRRGMEGRIRQRARQRRPAGRGRRRLSRAAAGAGHAAARGAAAARGRAVPHRRAHRSRAGSDSHRARGHGHASGRAARAPRCCRCCGDAHGFAGAGCSFVPRRVDDIDADALLRVDTCWSAATGLALVDMISASDFSARHLLMALDAGEPYRVARAMAIESVARGASPTGRKLSEQTRSSSRRRWRRASATRTRSRCRSWQTASLRRQRANGKRR